MLCLDFLHVAEYVIHTVDRSKEKNVLEDDLGKEETMKGWYGK